MGAALAQEVPVLIQLDLDLLEPRVLPRQQTFLPAARSEQLVLFGNKFLDVILHLLIAFNRHAPLLRCHPLAELENQSSHCRPQLSTVLGRMRPIRSMIKAMHLMASILVIYATKHGHTAKIAARTAEAMRSEVFDVELHDVEDAEEADTGSQTPSRPGR